MQDKGTIFRTSMYRSGGKETNRMKVVIENNVPMPKVRTRTEWPWEKLKVGQSFLAGIKATSMAPSAARQAKKLGRKFVVRTEGKGCRVWRTE